jgi:hypothetical protein
VLWARALAKSSLIALVIGTTACASTPRREIILNSGTERIEGWLDARGELLVFPDNPSHEYDPYSSDENLHCVTVVTDTPLNRSTAVALSGKKVRVRGSVIRYDELDKGDSSADKLLSKRYYKGTLVENSCLRPYIFVGRHIEASD